MQVAAQHTQSPISTSAYAIDSSSASRRPIAPQTPQQADTTRISASIKATNSPPSSRQPSRRPSGNASYSTASGMPQQHQFQPSTGSYPSASSTPRLQDMAATSRPSPLASMVPHSPLAPQIRREQQTQHDVSGGSHIQAPPRTSSIPRPHGVNPLSDSPLTNTGGAASGSMDRGLDERSSSYRHSGKRDARPGEESVTTLDVESHSRGESDQEPTGAAAAAAQSRRRGPMSPDRSQRVAGGRESRTPQSPPALQDRSSSLASAKSPSSPATRDESQVINKVLVTDPEIDREREKERQIEAVPTLGLVGSGGVDDEDRITARSRQGYSGGASRRKEMKFGDYVLGQTLGEGEFGKVKLGWKRDGSVEVAIKLIRRESLGSNPSRLPKIYREISILRELSHPNIVRLHAMEETERYIGIILEYASGGELFDFILNHRYLKDKGARRLFAQLVSGVGYLHKKGIVHRDLKLENLLLDRNRNIIITDFGFANTFDPRDELSDEIEYNLTNRDFVKRMNLERVQDNGSRKGDLMQTSCGSPCYAAPELVVTDSLYTGRKVDVWSCGVILYAMLAGYLPFDDDPANPEGDNINLLYKYIVSTPLTFPEYVTPHARDLLRRILVPDPRKRADLFEVARHSWLSDYADVVSHVTSSTTTVGEIANTTVSDQQDAPLLARSASVREPTKIHTPNMSPIGGLSHQGKLEPDQQVDKSKQSRDPKRRTVQVEYVAPQSKTARGEATPSVQSPVSMESSPVVGNASAHGRPRPGGDIPDGSSRQVSAASTVAKPLPQEPSIIETAGPAPYAPQPKTSRTQQVSGSSQAMAPPTRPSKDMPRSASDSTGIFGYPATSTAARPNTSGSMASSGAGKLQSRGNSYSQPVAPTVAATNAQGRLAQPKHGKQYIISAPIPQTDPSYGEQSIGRPSTQQNIQASSIRPQQDPPRGHKRSNTLGNVFARSGSFFGGKPQVRSPQELTKAAQEKKYPPTSMKTPIGSDSPRQSMESRRSTSFGFGRKNSDLRKYSEAPKQEKSRRFSLLPTSFSFKNLTGASRDQSNDDDLPASNPRSSMMTQRAPPSRGSRPQTTSASRDQDRSNSYRDENLTTTEDDGQRERSRGSGAPQSRRNNIPYPSTSQPQPSRYGSPPHPAPHEAYGPARRLAPPGQSYLTGTPTESEASLGVGPHRSVYPPGFDSYEDEPRPSVQQTRNARVLQKQNRRFADAYEQEQEPGYGTGGHHAGTSGAAKRVMDFFRRRGKARAGDDRV